MLSHVLRVNGSGVQACKGKISPDVHKRYLYLHQKSKLKYDSRKWVSDDVVEAVGNIQQSAAASLQFSCKKSTDQVPIKCVLKLDLKGQQQMTFIDCMMLHFRW